MKRIANILLLMISCQFILAETIVIGTVYDSNTLEPIENISVYYKNTEIGCSTNNEGLFMLRAELEKKQTLIVSAIGYKTQKYTIEPGQYVGIDIELEEKNTYLSDVFVVPGANPALPLMARVRSEKEANSSLLSAKGNDFEEQTSLFISDIEQKHLQRKLWKSLQNGMLQAEDSSYLLPLYSSTNRNGNTDVHTSVMTETDYTVLLSSLDGNVNFYNNNVTLFGKSFLSPLASSGNTYYNFYLVDSTQTDTAKTYLLHFKSKNPFYPTFNGEMTIDSATCALQHIDVSVPTEANVNYLSSLHISQDYYANHTLENEDLSVIFDFAVKSDSSHIFPTVLAQHRIDFAPAEILDTRPTVDKDSIAMRIDSLNNFPLVKVAKFAAYIINNGYIPTGTCIEFGKLMEIIQANPQEKFHFGIPVRTNEKLWKNVSLEAYAGYGIGDKAWKGKGLVQVNLPTNRRNIIGTYYWDHYVFSEVSMLDQLTRENGVGYGNMDFSTALFSNQFYNKTTAVNTMSRRREFVVWTENDITDILETRFDLRVGRMGYGDMFIDDEHDNKQFIGYKNIPSYSFKSMSALFRLGWHERKVDLYFKRYHIYSQYPNLFLYGEFGSFRTDNMLQERLYGQLSLMLKQRISMGMAGTLNYTIGAGMTLGKVPYPMLTNFLGNQTYTYDPYRFTLMNQYQYAADKYVFAHINWDAEGLLFNLIPGVRRLHLHELFEFKMAYGTLSNKHSEIIPLPQTMQSMDIPYVETGVGIGNILRVMNVYSVWRLTHIHNVDAPFWAVRFRFNIGL